VSIETDERAFIGWIRTRHGWSAVSHGESEVLAYSRLQEVIASPVMGTSVLPAGVVPQGNHADGAGGCDR